MRAALTVVALVFLIATLGVVEAKKQKPVQGRGLVTTKPLASSILKEHTEYFPETTVKNFKAGPTLAYVTPWNNHGYDVAKIFSCKFDYVAPVRQNLVSPLSQCNFDSCYYYADLVQIYLVCNIA